MTVYEKIKSLSISEMATLIAQMVDHGTGSDGDHCNCPIGRWTCDDDVNDGFCCQPSCGCDENALAWLKSEDELFVDVPCYLWEDNEQEATE